MSNDIKKLLSHIKNGTYFPGEMGEKIENSMQ